MDRKSGELCPGSLSLVSFVQEAQDWWVLPGEPKYDEFCHEGLVWWVLSSKLKSGEFCPVS